jgi:chaperonin GroEL (HSP60 family)
LELIVDAALTVAEEKDGKLVMRMDDIKIEKKKGGSILDSMLVKGVVLDKEVVHPGMPKRVEKAKILVLDTPLEVEKPDITAKINITDPKMLEAFLEEQTKILKEMVDKIAEIGANVVICQKGIDDVAAHFLAKKGIMAVRRVKRSDIEKVAKATGARIVTSLRDLSPEVLGEAELVEERRVGKDKMIFIEGAKNPRAVTILLRGSSDMALDEAERNIQDALHVIRNIMLKPKIVAGGGAVEIELAEKLREYAKQVGGKERLAIEAYADALEEIPIVLADTAGMDTLEVLTELRKLHREGKKWAGVDVINARVVDDMTKLNVIEPVRVKEQVLKSATEAANAILKIDDVIAAAPPKKKEKKGGGEEFKGPEF